VDNEAGTPEIRRLIDKFSLIQYELGIEEETRYLIDPLDAEGYDWVNHVVDTYDQAGRCRIRLKNGEPRLSIKIPLFSKDIGDCKTCIRIELKPQTDKQRSELLQIRDLILAEQGAQISEKWGAPMKLGDGSKVWINRDSNNRWWIEVDKGTNLQVPDGINIIGTEKSGIRA
jgi:hypothetical protein